MSQFMISGAMYSADSSSLNGYIVHENGMPFVTNDLEEAVQMIMSCVALDFYKQSNVDYTYTRDCFIGATNVVKSQYKIVDMGGSDVLATELFEKYVPGKEQVVITLCVNDAPIHGLYFLSEDDVKKWIDKHISVPIIVGDENTNDKEEIICDTLEKYKRYEQHYRVYKLVVTTDVFIQILNEYDGYNVHFQIAGFIERGDVYCSWKKSCLSVAVV